MAVSQPDWSGVALVYADGYYWARHTDDTTFVVLRQEGHWFTVGIAEPLRNFDVRQIVEPIPEPDWLICPDCHGRGGVLRRSYPGNEQFCYPCETCQGYGITHCCDGDQAGPQRCAECAVNYADPPSPLCPGCEAYRDHTR